MRDMTVRYNFIKDVQKKTRSEGGGIVISGSNPTTTGTIILASALASISMATLS